MTVERLQKIISRAGLMSRRAAEDLIRAGRVRVDGKVAVLGDRADASEVDLRIDGVPVPVAPDRVTYLVYKPVGVVSTADDPHGRETVVDLVPPSPRVYPVGRLDADSEGLLLVSNDGTLTQAVTHPSFGVTKTYTVLVGGRVSDAALRALRAGVELEDGPARPIAVKLLDRSTQESLIEVVMGEGRKREVRRMMDAIGHDVVRLVRTAIGPLTDRKLKPGEWRALDPDELARLYAAASWEQK